MSTPWGREWVSNNVDINGQGKGDLAVGGDSFQSDLTMSEEGIQRSFYHRLAVKIEK